MNLKASTNDFLKQCKRVLRVARKPDREEYFQFSFNKELKKCPLRDIVILKVIIVQFTFICMMAPPHIFMAS